MKLNEIRPQMRPDPAQQIVIRIHGDRHDPGPSARPLEQRPCVLRRDVARASGEEYCAHERRLIIERGIQGVGGGQAANLD